MGMFDFFRKKNVAELTTEPKASIEGNETGISNRFITIAYGTGKPIDVIYNYLKDDYESKGYNDALTNPDSSYKEMNKSMIKSNLEVKFKQVRLRYEDDLQTIEFHITSRKEAGLIELVKELETKKDILLKHIKELNKMEEDFINEVPYMTGMLFSYERGFLRGLAALSIEQIKSI
jgi:hypothetical protein